MLTLFLGRRVGRARKSAGISIGEERLDESEAAVGEEGAFCGVL